jgi:hypothetical protein
MANPEHIAQLMKGVTSWNAWREENPDIHPGLAEADLGGAHLTGANLWGADLRGASLGKVNLTEADLHQANLREADLSGARLGGATLVQTDLTGADLTGCRIYGVSAWKVKLDGAQQQNLIITPQDGPEVTVDNIEVAQFIHLLLHNEKIRHVIDTTTSKVVLILGRLVRMANTARIRGMADPQWRP